MENNHAKNQEQETSVYKQSKQQTKLSLLLPFLDSHEELPLLFLNSVTLKMDEAAESAVNVHTSAKLTIMEIQKCCFNSIQENTNGKCVFCCCCCFVCFF